MGNKKRYFATASAASSKDKTHKSIADDGEIISDSDLLGEAEHFHRVGGSNFSKSQDAAFDFENGDETSESEEEVLGLDLDDDDADLVDEDDDAADGERSDEDARDEYWGKHASSYYNTDYVGKDSGELNEEDIQIAEREQEEAGLLQGKLAQQFEAGFAQYQQLIAQDQQQQQQGSDFLTKGESGLGDFTQITSDVNKLTSEERDAFLQKKLPGYEEIFSDVKNRLEELNEWLLPSFQLFNNPQVPFSDYGKQYIAVKYKLCMSFCRYAVMCAALYNEGESIAGHPVLERIAETRTLLKMMDKAAGKFSDEMKILRSFISGADQLNEAQQQLLKTGAGMPKNAKKQRRTSSIAEEQNDASAEKLPNVQLMGTEADGDETAADEADDVTNGAENAENADDEEDSNKRPITYQIAKNKGLTPYRKKEYRNSRIRHKHKFKRATVRRKGQARQYRPETKKYAGEMGGIKAHISRSVKF